MKLEIYTKNHKNNTKVSYSSGLEDDKYYDKSIRIEKMSGLCRGRLHLQFLLTNFDVCCLACSCCSLVLSGLFPTPATMSVGGFHDYA